MKTRDPRFAASEDAIEQLRAMSPAEVEAANERLREELEGLPRFSGERTRCSYCGVDQVPQSKRESRQAMPGSGPGMVVWGGRGLWAEWLVRACRVCAHAWRERMPETTLATDEVLR